MSVRGSGPSAPTLDLAGDPAELARALVDVPSVSGDEDRLAGAVEAALGSVTHLSVVRDGNVVIARTDLGRARRVVLAGHLDTVPIAGNVPGRVEDGRLFGCGACDMKGGDAVALHLAATVARPVHDTTYAFYDCEEVEATRNGLGRIAREHPDWLAGDFAVLLEPTDGVVEGGCQGTLRVEVVTRGRRAHSARSWLGSNAVHAAAPVLTRLAGYEPRQVVVDGLVYREGLNAVAIAGGVAGNIIPDECVVTVNYRFAPDGTPEQAMQHVREVFAGFEVRPVDSAPAARPGLDLPVAAEFVAATGGTSRAKYGWTDVARFAALGIPAVNYGPGDPGLAHTPGEFVELEQVRSCARRLRAWLTSSG